MLTKEQLAFEEAIKAALGKIGEAFSGNALATYWECRLFDEKGAMRLSEMNSSTLEEILDDMAHVYTSFDR